MKLLPLLFLLPALAHASWFDFEAGIGVSQSKGMGDGVWVQQGAPGNREQLRSPAYLAGITGDLTDHLAWHADYVYFGGLSASVDGVPDANYDPHAHRMIGNLPRYSPFNGQGHTQGVMLTLEPHTALHGVRFGAEAGPFLYWATWHESLYALDNQWHDLSHKTVPQLGAVAGVSVGANGWKVAYRYFYQKQKWNPYPGMVTGTHMLTFEKRW
jgi:hypothetical protein